MYLTLAANKFDTKLIQKLTNLKLKFASAEDLAEHTTYIVGSVPQFPFDSKITYLVDNRLLKAGSIICSAGLPTESYTMEAKDLKRILDTLDNKIIYLDLE